MPLYILRGFWEQGLVGTHAGMGRRMQGLVQTQPQSSLCKLAATPRVSSWQLAGRPAQHADCAPLVSPAPPHPTRSLPPPALTAPMRPVPEPLHPSGWRSMLGLRRRSAAVAEPAPQHSSLQPRCVSEPQSSVSMPAAWPLGAFNAEVGNSYTCARSSVANSQAA